LQKHIFLLQGFIISYDNSKLPIGQVFSYDVRPGDHGQPPSPPPPHRIAKQFQVFGRKKSLSGKCLASDAEVDKLSSPGCSHLISDFSTLVNQTCCHCVANVSVSMAATSRTDLYFLLPMYHAHIYVKIYSSPSQCLLSCFKCT
jgi:hypothetical protein